MHSMNNTFLLKGPKRDKIDGDPKGQKMNQLTQLREVRIKTFNH